MQAKNFNNYLETRLSTQEITEIKEQAALEVTFFALIQKILSETLTDYMKEHNIGVSEVARKLHWSQTKVLKVQKGEANATLTSLAHFFAVLGKEPHDVFKKTK